MLGLLLLGVGAIATGIGATGFLGPVFFNVEILVAMTAIQFAAIAALVLGLPWARGIGRAVLLGQLSVLLFSVVGFMWIFAFGGGFGPMPGTRQVHPGAVAVLLTIAVVLVALYAFAIRSVGRVAGRPGTSQLVR